MYLTAQIRVHALQSRAVDCLYQVLMETQISLNKRRMCCTWRQLPEIIYSLTGHVRYSSRRNDNADGFELKWNSYKEQILDVCTGQVWHASCFVRLTTQ